MNCDVCGKELIASDIAPTCSLCRVHILESQSKQIKEDLTKCLEIMTKMQNDIRYLRSRGSSMR